MKKYILQFAKQGLVAAWGGPVIVAIVWLSIYGAGAMDTLAVPQAALGIISSAVMAFIAAGLPVVYQVEKLPLPMAILIHCAGLYADYLIVYLMNGWMLAERGPITVFTLCFVGGFALIWLIIYLVNRRQADFLNKKMKLQ